MSSSPFLRAAITFDYTDRDAWARLAHRWLTLGLERLLPDLKEPLDLGDPALEARIVSTPSIDDPLNNWRYTPVQWRKTLNNLVEQPYSTTLSIFRENADSGPRLANLNASYCNSRGQWQELIIDATVPEEAASDPDYCRNWVEFLLTVLNQADPVFGMVTNDYRGIRNTALECALYRPFPRAMREARHTLRGYAWVTVCPRELLPRLGGIDHLRRSGAFSRVEPLSAGGAVLQATDTAHAYDDTAMHKVFTALAPVLPAGSPDPKGAPEHARLKAVT
ncbi:hypothetical protein [Thermomonospora amylolytica]|uniref:hypothetical protein n=1 Tax=Thermomonospora amylolytica TaxID=1411117 RepID=UPI00130064E4|nr:hypothetical protein [Thermomonospora amylolytica]